MVDCRICDSKNKKLLFNKYGFDIVKCNNCSLVYSDFHPTNKFLEKYYCKNYFVGGKKKLGYDNYGHEEQSSRLTARKRIGSLKLSQTGSVLDAGCAYGFYLSEMPSSWNKYGVEISHFAFSKAIKLNPDAHIKRGILTKRTFDNRKFDLITFWDVVEHLDNPAEVMAVAYKKLKKGGKLAISTGDVSSLFSKIQRSKWHLFTPPQHLSFFSPTTIKLLLKSIGFKNINISHSPAYYPVSYVFHKLDSMYGINLPMFTIKDLVVPINLGDIMVLTAIK